MGMPTYFPKLVKSLVDTNATFFFKFTRIGKRWEMKKTKIETDGIFKRVMFKKLTNTYSLNCYLIKLSRHFPTTQQ